MARVSIDDDDYVNSYVEIESSRIENRPNRPSSCGGGKRERGKSRSNRISSSRTNLLVINKKSE